MSEISSAASELGIEITAFAAPVQGGAGVGHCEHQLVSPASVMKIQVAVVVEQLIADGVIDGAERRVLPGEPRTPGPVGMSLMRDEVTMSVRDLVVAMLTISDNVATDELIAVAGLDRINHFVRELGLEQTVIASDLRGMLNDIALEAGFADYDALAAHDPDRDGAPSWEAIGTSIANSAAMDPNRGPRTTPHDMVALLQSLWTDRAGDPSACQNVRRHMANQLSRTRIASGFDPSVAVAAKSGALLKIVRNEAGVVTYPDGSSFAVAVFTRKDHDNTIGAARIDFAIGRVARSLVDDLRSQ